MYTVIVALKIVILVGILVLYFRWRKRFSSSEQVLEGIRGFAGWAQNNKEKMLGYTRIAEVVVGVFLLCLGYYIGKDHFHLIRDGVRVPGTIVGYKQEYFPGSFGQSSRSSQAFMPIVKFQAGLEDVEFKDWMGTNNAVKNIQVTVLYDPDRPSLAMIDRPVWNWIPWAPTLGVGLFCERYVNRILRNAIAMVRLAEARGVQLKNSRPLSLARRSRAESRQSARAAPFASHGERCDILV